MYLCLKYSTLDKVTSHYFPVGVQTCPQWLCTVMDHVSINLKYKGGSIRMAAASAAIHLGVPIDVVLSEGRWVS